MLNAPGPLSEGAVPQANAPRLFSAAARCLRDTTGPLPKGAVPQGKATLTSNNPGGPLLMRAVFREGATPSLSESTVLQAGPPLRFESPSAL